MDSLAHTWIVSAIAVALIAYALAGWLRRGFATDLRYALTIVPWLALVCVDYAVAHGWLPGYERLATRVAYQVLILGVSVFLLCAMDNWASRHHALQLALAQFAAGLGLALAPLPGGWHAAWFGLNALCSTLLVLMVAQTTWARSGARGWMVLLMAIFGLGVMLADMRAAGDGPLRVSVSHYFYVVCMFVLWLALTRRVGAQLDTQMPAERERERLAQDLHDGVGSQLASIISALDMGTPQQRATAASLQQCLVELKLLVDGADSDASALSHLASLRYRMQPLLEAAGITLHWRVADDEVIDSVRGDAARQILRIAQETLANAVRHSGASEVAVTCCHIKARRSLLLEIVDNGVGMSPDLLTIGVELSPGGNPRLGKGLPGMERRARRLGGRLVIDAVHGRGTRVRLLAPMARLTAGNDSERAA